MKKILFILILSLLVVSKGAVAQQDDDQKLLDELGITHEEDHVEYKFPEIKPEGELFLGYRFIDASGSERALEYGSLDAYPVTGGRFAAFKYPHRIHIDLDFNNTKDYQGDLFYAYGDLFLTRWSDNTMFHNLDNIELVTLDPSSTTFKIDPRDGDEEYGVRTAMHSFLMRLKAPDFPAHTYFKWYHVEKDGNYQQRDLLGSGFYNDMVRTTQERDITSKTATYEFGANSHIGHAEVELSHIEKRFSVKGDTVMFDDYTASLYHPAGGTLPHNKIPELEGSSNVLKIHSIYNESLVASATFSIKERENTGSGANADIFNGAGSIQWTPLTRLSFFMRYSHTDIDADNTSVSSITDINGTKTIYPAGSIKPAVSKTTDTFSLTGRYNPEHGVILKAKYFFENIERDHASDWDLQDSTRKDGMLISADLNVIKNLKLKAEYIHKTIDQPSYNTEPDYSNEGVASVFWAPVAGVNLLLNYSITKEERSGLAFTETQDAKNRNTRMDNIMGSGTFQLMSNLSLNTSYAYMRYKIRQDIVYGDVALSIDSNVKYEDKAQFYSASLNYVPVNRLNLFATVSLVKNSGEFYPGSSDLLEPVSIASFSTQKGEDTFYGLSADYEWLNGFSGSAEFQYSDINDVIDNIHDSNQDGHAYIVMLKLNKKWR